MRDYANGSADDAEATKALRNRILHSIKRPPKPYLGTISRRKLNKVVRAIRARQRWKRNNL